MTPLSPQQISGDAWTIARSQHDVITHAQVCSLGYTLEAIRHRLRTGRQLDLMQVEQLREEIETLRGRPGVAALRALIDRATFRYSDSELERASTSTGRRWTS